MILSNEYSNDEINFIKEHSYILPLVIANNKCSDIRLTGDNRYMFLCQMHKESMPSMGVYDLLNYYYCFGCGFGNNAVGYLMKYEKLKFKDALKLLSQIFLLAIKEDDSKLFDIANKYKKAILSEEYKELLIMGKERLKNNQFNNSKLLSVDILKEYENRFHTIYRISNNIYIDPKIKNNKLVKSIIK